MRFVLGLLALLLVIDCCVSKDVTIDNHIQLDCISIQCHHGQLCHIRMTNGQLQGQCIHPDKHTTYSFGCSNTLANNEACYCNTQECIKQMQHHTTITGNIKVGGAGGNAQGLNCGGHFCHTDQACEHQLENGVLKSHCKKIDEVQKHDVDCQTSLPTHHVPCYCLTNACTEHLNNQLYHHTLSGNHNQRIQCGEHLCQAGQFCLLQDHNGDFHFKCSDKIEHNAQNCLPNLFTENQFCYCQTEECVNHALISILNGFQTTGIVCGNHDLKTICHRFQTCVITHLRNGIFDRQCQFPLWIPECHSAPSVGDECACYTQNCVYGEFTVHTTTTMAPTTGVPRTTHAGITKTPSSTAGPTVIITNATTNVVSTNGPTIATNTNNLTVSANTTHSTVASSATPVVSGTHDPTVGLTTHAPTVAATVNHFVTSASTSAPMCFDKEDNMFSCSSYDKQYNLCMASSGTLHTIANNRCRKYCGICQDGSNTTSQYVTVSVQPPSQQIVCTDHDSRCAQYQSNICKALDSYVIATCAKTCNRCPEYIASLAVPTTTPVPTPTSAPKSPTSCFACGDLDSMIPCYSRDVYNNSTRNAVQCPAGSHFCMTDILHDAHGNADVFKRCVTEQTCQTKWITESADLDYCAKYGSVHNPSAFECHFCCTGDHCNTGIKPPDSVLVAKPTGR